MSISTMTGDAGMTSLLYGRRVTKTDRRIIALGDIEELSAALGVARAALGSGAVADLLKSIQRDLVDLCPGIAADTQDRDRYQESNLAKLSPAALIRLEDKITELESRNPLAKELALPGESLPSAYLHLARTIARRAERSTLAIRELAFVVPPLTLRYLNRLGDLLWLLAETKA
jgi:cob(I)alamin adenosyltransferase